MVEAPPLKSGFLAAACLVVCACGPNGQAAGEAEASRSEQASAEDAPAFVIRTERKKPLGPYLADGEGRSLYTLQGDTQGRGGSPPKSACTGPCTEQWPPVTADAPPEALGEVQGESLSTFTRTDGKTQVAYNGWPLYHYYNDQQPGYVEGQATHDTWGSWYLLAPTGRPIEAELE